MKPATDSEGIMDELTRRELFSVSQNAASQSKRADPGEVSQWARTYADALAELMREQVAGGQ
jgi:hypothetical protein